MKHRITLSIALVLSVVLLSLMRSDSTANAAPPQRYSFATGVLTPATGQTLRVMVGEDGNGATAVRFRWAQYGAPVCSGTPAVCRHMIDSQGATPVIMSGNDALSFDFNGDGNAVNIAVESNTRNVRVNAMIIDGATGKIVVAWKVEEGEE